MSAKKKSINSLQDSERDRHGQDSSSGRKTGRPERRDKVCRRCAEKLVDDKPHCYVEVAYEIFICKYCGQAIWQPHSYQSAVVYAHEIEEMGRTKAYMKRIGGIARMLDRISNGDMTALDDYKPQKVDETEKMYRLLAKKGLVNTLLGEL